MQTEPLAFPLDVPADSGLHAAGPELLTHMADGLPTGKTWVRGNEGLPSPSCTQGPCKSRSVRTINCTLDGDTVTISYSRKVSDASWSCCVTCCCLRPDCDSLQFCHRCLCLFCTLVALHQCAHARQVCARLVALQRQSHPCLTCMRITCPAAGSCTVAANQAQSRSAIRRLRHKLQCGALTCIAKCLLSASNVSSIHCIHPDGEPDAGLSWHDAKACHGDRTGLSNSL